MVVHTFVVLLHQWQIDVFQAVEIVDARTFISDARYIAQGQKCFASKIVGRQHVVVHGGECNHCTLSQTLFQSYRKLEAFVEVWIQSFLKSKENWQKEYMNINLWMVVYMFVA